MVRERAGGRGTEPRSPSIPVCTMQVPAQAGDAPPATARRASPFKGTTNPAFPRRCIRFPRVACLVATRRERKEERSARTQGANAPRGGRAHLSARSAGRGLAYLGRKWLSCGARLDYASQIPDWSGRQHGLLQRKLSRYPRGPTLHFPEFPASREEVTSPADPSDCVSQGAG